MTMMRAGTPSQRPANVPGNGSHSWLVPLGWTASAGQGLFVVFVCTLCSHAFSARQLTLLFVLPFLSSLAIVLVTRGLRAHQLEQARVRLIAEQGERLAALATLSMGAAHELSSPLTTIAVAAGELLHALEDAEQVADARLIREQVLRCREILAQMARAESTRADESASRISVLGLVRASLDKLRAPERVVLEWAPHFDPSAELVVPVRATARALRNVLNNALDASSPAEPVVLRVGRAGAEVSFEVLDRGAGMTPEVLARISEPFFSTKREGAGLGLGMYLTRTVIELLGGRVHVESTPGVGTRATCYVPSAPHKTRGFGASLAPRGLRRDVVTAELR